MNVGPLKLHGDRQIGSDLTVTASFSSRMGIFKYVMYRRDTTDPIDLTVSITMPGWGEFVIREQLGFTGSYWIFWQPVELPIGAIAKLSTSGAGGSEDHTGLVVIEEMSL